MQKDHLMNNRFKLENHQIHDTQKGIAYGNIKSCLLLVNSIHKELIDTQIELQRKNNELEILLTDIDGVGEPA